MDNHFILISQCKSKILFYIYFILHFYLHCFYSLLFLLHAAMCTAIANPHTTPHTRIFLNVKTRKCEGQDEEDGCL